MYNKKGESKMDKTILVVEIITYHSGKKSYNIKKHAPNLDKASEYLVALKNLNEDTDVEFQLFNRLGQFDVERIEKVESEETDEIRF
tara:strand:- start:29 stop:289 length:261 start_codon:yes stop_codon:yes gene_type:complete